jgi:hypothetical protein
MKRTLLTFIIALWAFPVAAQTSLLPTVQKFRAQYPTPMSRPQLGDLLNRIAWEHRAEGWGLLKKTGGSNCPAPQGVPVSCDILVHAPTIQHFDILSDAENSAGPTWRNVGPCVLGPSSGCAMSNFLAPVRPIGGGGSYTKGDFDRDGKADLAVFRPNEGRWYSQLSTTGATLVLPMGLPGDIALTGDYDGDRLTDPAVFRPSNGTWYILPSSAGYASLSIYQWGESTDVPVSADLDGDTRSDLVVYRPRTGQWFAVFSSTSFTRAGVYQWGMPGDIPLAADFDGDGKGDLVNFRPSTGEWWILTSSSSLTAHYSHRWGVPGDVPIAGDFDQDGRADLIVYRPSDGTWYGNTSSSNFTVPVAVQWGLPGDQPVAADFDGDGFPDIAVFRPASGHWFILRSMARYGDRAAGQQFGLPGDIALPTP